MIRRPPRSTLSSSSAASDVYKRQPYQLLSGEEGRGTWALGWCGTTCCSWSGAPPPCTPARRSGPGSRTRRCTWRVGRAGHLSSRGMQRPWWQVNSSTEQLVRLRGSRLEPFLQRRSPETCQVCVPRPKLRKPDSKVAWTEGSIMSEICQDKAVLLYQITLRLRP